jgi:hypothetical protein
MSLTSSDIYPLARRLLHTMRAVAREAGHPAAYPRTREGRLAALRQRLRATTG